MLALLAVAAPIGAAEPGTVNAELLREARATAVELGGRLKSQLESAMQSGGPEAALAVCNAVAPAIAGDLAVGYDGEVGRTALKVRNADNAPDAYERGVLEDFAARAAQGADPATLEHAEIVAHDGHREFRYMKAIPMAETPCASCHGVAVAPTLQEKIRALYPADAATGFAPGDIRGAFTLRKILR